ncbi:hypothetical protein SAMN05216511_0752 [Streptomyces sp. KS_16]|nr:hypothetical protein SAMN05216511_0752 [Streptomyces sp. KS_16]
MSLPTPTESLTRVTSEAAIEVNGDSFTFTLLRHGKLCLLYPRTSQRDLPGYSAGKAFTRFL